MRVQFFRFTEFIGIGLLLVSTAMQIFYLEPLKREIEWRLVAFSVQQSAQIQLKAIYDNQLSLLRAMNAPDDRIRNTEAARDQDLRQYKNSDADIADVVLEKEAVEGYLEILVLGIFTLGTVLTGLGRFAEMQHQ